MKDWAKGFYASAAWHRCRRSFVDKRIAIDGGLCQKCGEKPGFIVHHVVELNEFNITDSNVALRHGNLMYVCHDCHNEIHKIAVPTINRQCLFDENGDVVGVV